MPPGVREELARTGTLTRDLFGCMLHSIVYALNEAIARTDLTDSPFASSIIQNLLKRIEGDRITDS